MRILCCAYRASVLTGSELYFFELCNALTDLGHEVTLAADGADQSFFYRGLINNRFNFINLKDINQDYDIILLSHYKETFKYVEKLAAPIVNIVHSEIYDSEVPLLHPRVVKYVAIRPTICDKIRNLGARDNLIELVRNPIDLTRFNTNKISDDKIGLFVGTMGGVRYKAALHFANFCKWNNLKSVYISAENQAVPWFDVCLPVQVDIEKFFKSCSISGGVLQGRTYYEAKLCGKPTVEYFINNMGNITGIEYEDAPDEIELTKLRKDFDKHEVAKRIINLQGFNQS